MLFPQAKINYMECLAQLQQTEWWTHIKEGKLQFSSINTPFFSMYNQYLTCSIPAASAHS